MAWIIMTPQGIERIVSSEDIIFVLDELLAIFDSVAVKPNLPYIYVWAQITTEQWERIKAGEEIEVTMTWIPFRGMELGKKRLSLETFRRY